MQASRSRPIIRKRLAIIDRALTSANPGDHWVKFGGVGIKYTDLQQCRDRLAGSDAESSMQLVDPSAAGFYRLLRRLSDVEIPADVGDFRMVEGRALEAYKTMREDDRFVRGMLSWVGFRQTGVLYKRDERYAGTTKYPLRRMLHFALDRIVSFSNAPLRLALGLGFVVSLASFAYGFVAIILKAPGAFTVPGWASVIFVFSFLGGYS